MVAEDERIKRILDSLRKSYDAGKISQQTYERLRRKWEAKITSRPERLSEVPAQPVSEAQALLDDAFRSVLTRAYVCDNCGAALQVQDEQRTTRCTYCGVVNEVDYLERISERFREEKKKMLQGVISSLASASMVNLRMPAFMKFKSIVLPYENRAIENERNAWSHIAAAGFTGEDWVKDHCFEASKHRHYAAELYQNASEFATTQEDKLQTLVSFNFNEGLGFLDAATAFLWVTETETSLICKRRMAMSALSAVNNFVEAYELLHNDVHRNYAIISKILVYIGAEFWLRAHEMHEMFALALYLKTTDRGKVWDIVPARDLVTSIVDRIVMGRFG